MKIYIAADHAGFKLKNYLKKQLLADGYDLEDCGAFNFDPLDDYPDFIIPAAEKVKCATIFYIISICKQLFF